MSFLSNLFKSTNKITVNGETITVKGDNISVVNGKVIVDGVVIKEGLTGDVHVKFEGNLAKLDATNVTVNGSVIGDVNCTSLKVSGSINGDVDATNVSASEILGKVDATNVTGKIKM